MKKVLFVLLLVAVLIGSFVSCKEEPAHEHTWDAGKITTPATCEVAGVKTYSCECGETKTEAIPALGHKWDTGKITTPATCEDAGVKTFTCQNNNTHTKTEAIPALGHNWDAGTQTTPPTCGTDGVKTYTCQNNNTHTKTEPISATGEHTWGEWENTTPATCGAAGEKTSTCSGCGTTKTEPIPATGEHTWGDWVNTTPSTVLAEGVDTRTCTVCSATETRPAAKLELEVATFAAFKEAFSLERQEGDTYTIKLTADIEWEGDAFEPTATGITVDLGGHTISEVPKNYFNLKGDSFTLKNGTITGNSSNDRYSININYNGTNATTSNNLKEAALAATPAAYTEEDAVWAKRVKVENITATGMLCGYCTMEIKDCTFSGGKYRGLVMQGASGTVENVTVDAPSASSAGFVAHSYGTVLVKGTCSFKGKFAIYSANCPILIFDPSAVVTATGVGTHAFYLENQGKIDIKAGATLTLIPKDGQKTIFIRTGSMVDIAAGAILKDSTDAEIAKPFPASLVDDNASTGAKDNAWPGYGVANVITDNRT